MPKIRKIPVGRTTSAFRFHVDRHGDAKKPYETREEAEAAAIRYNQQAYRCKLCERWHTGGRRQPPPQVGPRYRAAP